MQPRKGNQGWCLGSEVTAHLWSLNPLFPPLVQYLSAVLWPLRIWKAATPDVTRPLIYSSKQAMIQLFLPSSAKKESVINLSLATLQESEIYLGLAAAVAF